MNNQEQLFKGELKEEYLREYFLELGYYVVRGIKYNYENFEITDIDLWLYSRPSPISRERINVDIKNKRTPQAIERIFWTKGLKEVLKLDNCIVATTDKRPSVRKFGQEQGVQVLDGNFLAKLNGSPHSTRMYEEELYILLQSNGKYNYRWKDIYENSKTRLLRGLDFSSSNETMRDIKLTIEEFIVNKQFRAGSGRLLYLLASHLLIIVDFILKDISFYDNQIKSEILIDGFKYGNIGREGLERTLDLALKLSDSSSSKGERIKALYEDIPVYILRDFFIKSENSKNLFRWAKEFETLGYDRLFCPPLEIPPALQSVLFMLLDFLNVDRKTFANYLEVP